MDDVNNATHVVYISCADTLQNSFASHLSRELRRKGISPFVNSKGSLDLIERASAFVVVFSKDYLSSTSCLDKLVKALQCRRKNSQLVVPVFYGVSPSDVVAPEHESADRVREWSSALQELRELPGHQSREEFSASKLMEEIVKDVYEKLSPTEKIGVNSKLQEMEHLLCKQTWCIRRIGIWGMAGIGKTTLAKSVFDQISEGYEASCYIEHFHKAFHEKGLHRLLEEHFEKILKELPRVCSKRTLVVLDDVQNPLVAESFLGGFHWFGPGSLIIITSRDKQVFRLCQINHVYEVQSLNENEALQLFSQCASKEDIRQQNLLELSKEVIDYANGNPLALSFYGRELKGKKVSEMEKTFRELKQRTPYKIHDLFKSSYETLNENQKDIFLDIACFFNGDNVDYVMQLLEGCGFFPHVGIDALVEKCLVTISKNRVQMHNLIQDFGRERNNGEAVEIERRRRLWEPWAIKYLLEDDKIEENGDPKATYTHALGTEDIESILLDTSNLLFDVKPTAFENMHNLRFLKIFGSSYDKYDGLCLPKGLDSLPPKLRLLHWEKYPLRSLPQKLGLSHLVELDMRYSQIQKLWGETTKLVMLKRVRLGYSQQLTEIDEICQAQNIELIDLQGCTKLRRFPAIAHLNHLQVVNLSGCREIESFPDVSPNIVELDLQGTGIRALPISIGNATKLEKLNLGYCSSLVKLPSIGKASNLKEFYLTGCSSLVELPTSIGNATNLGILDLSKCSSLKKLPSSIGDCIKLEKFNIVYCSSLVELPSSIGNVTNLEELDLTGCSSLVMLPSSIRNFTSLNEDYNLPIVTFSDNSGSRCIEVRRANKGNVFVLKGEQNDEHSVSLTLCIEDENGSERKTCFRSYREGDTASKVSNKMVERLDLTDTNATFITELIDTLLVNMIPTWKTYVAVHQNEAKTQRQEETAFHDSRASVSHSLTLDYPPSDKEDKKCVDSVKLEDRSSNQEAEVVDEPVSLEDEEEILKELEEKEAKHQEEMKAIARKREVILEAKRKRQKNC